MRKGGVIAIIIIAVLVIAAVVGFIVYSNANTTETPVETDTGYQEKTGGNLGFEEDQTGIVKKSDDAISIPGWDKITIDAGESDVYVDFYNPSSNDGKCYLTFELRLADTGEVLYTSKYVKAGDHVKKITLSRPLDAGTYDAVIHIQPYSADDALQPMNNADIKVVLIAE